MMPEISIIIPTCSRLDLLKKCIASLIQNTDLTDKEIIIVSNGSSDETLSYLYELRKKYGFISFCHNNNKVGYTKAINVGIQLASGKYILLFSDDVEVLPYKEKNYWIEELLRPLEENSKTLLTGCRLHFSPQTNREFLVFFCVLINRQVFEVAGLPDEIFNPGFGEDIDFCHKIQDSGYAICAVPSREEALKYSGSFPLYHEGEGTIKYEAKFNETIKRNCEILAERYSTDFDHTKITGSECDYLPEGWFTKNDIEVYRRLVSDLENGAKIAEIGVYKGRSICSLAHFICKKQLQVYAIDNFLGPPELNYQESQLLQLFLANIHHFHIDFYVKTLQTNSDKAALEFGDEFFDFIFIDADHTTEGVKRDVSSWLPKLKRGSVLAGHDWEWASVRGGVLSSLNKNNLYVNGNMWWYVNK